MQFIEKNMITFLSVQELQGVQDDQAPILQLMGIGLFTALALLVPIPLAPQKHPLSSQFVFK